MKRILLLALTLLIGLSSQSFAITRTGTFGDYNASGVYRMRADVDDASGAGYITFAQDTGIVDPYLATATTNTTLTAFQSGTTVIANNGNGTLATNTMYTLPSATVGLNYSFILDVAKAIIIHPTGTDAISYASIPAGNGITNSSAAKGDTIELFCGIAGKWDVKNIGGTWANSNQ